MGDFKIWQWYVIWETPRKSRRVDKSKVILILPKVFVPYL